MNTNGTHLAGTNIEHAGVHNQRVVLQTIRVHGPLTKADLARRTGLTHPTISNITSRLLACDLLTTAGQRRGERGQPAMRLAVNPRGAHSVGINIDRDHVTIVVVDFGGTVRARATLEIAFALPAQVDAFFRREVDRLLAVAGVTREMISGVGIALPDNLGEIEMPGRPGDYGQWSTIRIADLLGSVLDVPVHVENDAAAAAIGEMQFGRGQRLASFFYILVTFGLGGGLVVHAMYDRGADGRSGEIGFLVVDDGEGGATQLQNIVSLAGLSRHLEMAGYAGASIDNLDMSDRALVRLIDDWVDAAARALAQPLIAVNCLINPEAILIGGRLPIAILDRLAQRANARLRVVGRNAPVLAPVQTAALAEDASAVGAALLSFGNMLMPADSRGPCRPGSAASPAQPGVGS